MQWLNEPRLWRAGGGGVEMTTDAKTDFWQATYYGFRNDSGHFYYDVVAEAFTAEVTFRAEYSAQYDQAGLMLRFGPDHWLKAGVEFAHGRCTLGSVLTVVRSDWAVGPEIDAATTIRLRITRTRDAVCVQWTPELDDTGFRTLRLGPVGDGEAKIGMFACSPSRAGLLVRFTDFSVASAIDIAHVV